MRQIVLLPLVTLVVCLTIGSTNAQTTDNTTVPHKRRVPARVIPVPRTVTYRVTTSYRPAPRCPKRRRWSGFPKVQRDGGRS